MRLFCRNPIFVKFFALFSLEFVKTLASHQDPNTILSECVPPPKKYLDGTITSPLCTLRIPTLDNHEETQIQCLELGTIRIVGEYDVLYINCSASHAVDVNFDGIKPTEAIWTKFWKKMKPTNNNNSSERSVLSHHVDVKVSSILRLYNDFHGAKNASHFHQQKAEDQIHEIVPDYSRSGKFLVSGFHKNANNQLAFNIFLEEKLSRPTFIRNEHMTFLGGRNVVQISSTKSVSSNETYTIPCRPTHQNATVILETGSGQLVDVVTSGFSYDPTLGFTKKMNIDKMNQNVTDNERHRYICKLFYNQKVVDLLEILVVNDKSTTKPSQSNNNALYHYGIDDDLVSSSDVKIQHETETLANGSVVIRCKCHIRNLIEGQPAILTNIPIPNPAAFKLMRHFVLPSFSNQSYSLQHGRQSEELNKELIWDEGSTLLVGTTFCGQHPRYAATAYGTTVHGKYLHFEMDQDWSALNRERSNISIYFKIRHHREGGLFEGPNKILYGDTLQSFTCQVNNFVFVPPMIWYTVRLNGSTIEEFIDYDWQKDVSRFSKILPVDVTRVVCAASFWYKDFWRNISMGMELKASNAPVFLHDKMSVDTGHRKFVEDSANQFLKCSAHGSPPPVVYWQKDGKNLTSVTMTMTQVNDTVTANLEFERVHKNLEGLYVCVAKNFLGLIEKKINLNVEPKESPSSNLLMILIPITVFLCTIIGAYVCIRFFRQEKTGLTREELEEFLSGQQQNQQTQRPADGNHGNSGGGGGGGDGSNDNEYAHEFAPTQAYNKDYEISRDAFQLDETSPLGSGAFGLVLKGVLNGHVVAVKTLKKNADKAYLRALLSELKIMIYLGSHQNLVQLKGACTKELRKGLVYILVDFCELGSLETYLKTNRSQFLAPLVSNDYTNMVKPRRKSVMTQSDEFTIQSLMIWSLQIAQGMAYLSEKKVIHGDLACRNILLTSEAKNGIVAKITDFGLSRQLQEYAQYVKTHQEPLPWRTMALESLRDLTFTTKSDVWSFGVILFEIFSLGEVPYPGYRWNLEFVEEIERGLRMSRPKYGSQNLYDELMVKCWDKEPKIRPSFRFICDWFEQEMEQQ